jgi:hypothetical protein
MVSRMPTPVEVSCVRTNAERIEALGGMWNGQPWSLSEWHLIEEIELPDDKRQWDFFVTIAGAKMPVVVRQTSGRKHLAVNHFDLLGLPEMPRERALGWEV